MARKKHVFSTAEEVAHIFFHRSENIDNWAKDPGNRFSWRNDSIYSYNSEIARVYSWEKRILLFRGSSYSITTSKHQRAVLQAVPLSWNIINWANWNNFPDLNALIDESIEEAKSVKELVSSRARCISNCIVDYQKRRLINNFTLLDRMDILTPRLEELEKYRFTKEETELYHVKTWARSNNIKGSIKNKIKWYRDPKSKEFKEIESKALVWGEAYRWKECNPIPNTTLYECYSNDEYKSKCEDAYYRLLEEEKKEILLKQKEKIRLWQLDHINSIRYTWNIPTHLKLKNDEIITSLNAKFPVTHGKLAYRQFKKCIEEDKPWVSNGFSIKVGYYKVESITKMQREYPDVYEWCITAGCHKIFETEIKQFIEFYKLDW